MDYNKIYEAHESLAMGKSPEAYWEGASSKDEDLTAQMLEDFSKGGKALVMEHLGYYIEEMSKDFGKSAHTLLNIMKKA